MLRVYTRDSDHLVAHSINVNATEQQPFPEGTVPWLDLLNPTPEEDRYVEAAVGVSIPTREEMQEIEVSSRLYNENGAEFMTMTAVTRIDTDEPQLTPITFVLKGSTLVTVRYAEPRPFMMFALRVQRANAVSCGTGEQVMLSLMEALIDRIADALEKVGAKIDAISREVFKHEDSRKKSSKTADFQKIIVDIGREGDLVSMARESLLSMNRVLTYHTAVADDSKRALKEIRSRVRSLQRDVSSLTDHSTYLSTKINFLLDATLGLIDRRRGADAADADRLDLRHELQGHAGTGVRIRLSHGYRVDDHHGHLALRLLPTARLAVAVGQFTASLASRSCRKRRTAGSCSRPMARP